jgi:hypothetical protein
MALIITLNKTDEEIIKGLDKLNQPDKLTVLAYIRALHMHKRKRKAIANPPRGLKPLTMAQIDRIKHEVRKQYADK